MPPSASSTNRLALRAWSAPSLTRTSSLDDQPICRYCWGSEADADADFVSPCACQGTTQHVHYKCLVKWVSASLTNRKQGTPGHCEICKQRFFGASRQQHDLLLATAYTELELSQLYTAAALHDDASRVSSGTLRAGLRGQLEQAMAGYWALALRPIQAAMLLHSLLSPVLPQGSPASAMVATAPGHRGLLAAAGACAAHAASWWAGGLCEMWVRAYVGVGRSASAALAVAALVHGAGCSLHGWLHGQRPGATAFHLSLPLSLPFFPQLATALAALGTLFPGYSAGADGLRAAALAPLLALRWALEAGGKRGWLLGALCRALTAAAGHLRAAVLPPCN